MKPEEELQQNIFVISALSANVQNLTANELLEFIKEMNAFSERVKHIYVNAALQGRLTNRIEQK